MAKGKKPTGRKAAAGKAAVDKPKPRKRSAAKKSTAKPGIGHNKPPTAKVPAPAPPISSWASDDQSAAQIAHAAAARQRSFRAAISGEPPNVLHTVMLNRIAALEETIAKLEALPEAERIKPRLLDDSEIDEIRNILARVKALSPAPAQRPPDAVEAESKLRTFGEQLLLALAVQAATVVISAPLKELWASYGHQLIDLAQSIGEWYANLPPPPPLSLNA